MAAGGSDRFVNRELSWLDFNERVLAVAEDPAVPLLERAKFLAIFATNLDDFFQVRVAGLMEQVAAGVSSTPPDGMTPTEQLNAVRRRAASLSERHAALTRTEILPALAAEGIIFADPEQLDPEARAWVDDEFLSKVFPVLTPLAVDPAHPFPYISNLSLNLAVTIRDPQEGSVRFARVKVPPILPRFLALPDGKRFVLLEQVMASHLGDLFPGMEILSHHPFRVTRNADLVLEEAEADDLLEAVAMELNRRRFGRAVRLEVEHDMDPETLRLLVRELQVTSEDVHFLHGPLDLNGMWAPYALDRPELKWSAWHGVGLPALTPMDGESPSIFAALSEQDFIVQHPYDAFAASVNEFIAQASRDPHVLAIKLALYRTDEDSEIMRNLITAAHAGKQVVALVELKARFDEERNIEWARRLEEAGVHVVYGLVGLKTHAKVTLVVRQEGELVRRYAHIGTGNYNGATARIYEDLGLLTADPEIGADLGDLFNHLTGYSRQGRFRKLLVAPFSLRDRIMELIRREAAAEDGHVVMKLNSLVDPEVIDELYAASAAGTKVELYVRGICCLRAGVPGLSENITVRSIVGRFLEHSRIWRFGTRARGYDYFIGSADMMPRNLKRRVEALVPIERPQLRQRIEEILDVLSGDDRLAWDLQADGSWLKTEQAQGYDTHEELQRRALLRAHHT